MPAPRGRRFVESGAVAPCELDRQARGIATGDRRDPEFLHLGRPGEVDHDARSARREMAETERADDAAGRARQVADSGEIWKSMSLASMTIRSGFSRPAADRRRPGQIELRPWWRRRRARPRADRDGKLRLVG